MIRGVHHMAVATGDLDRLVGFYTEHLGFEIVMETSWRNRPVIDKIIGVENSAARQVMLRAGNTHLEVFQYESPPGLPGDPDRPPADHGYTHFCLDVTDIDSEYERLLAAGMRFHGPPPTSEELGTNRLRAIYGRDPDGNLIELQEVLDTDLPFAFENMPALNDPAPIGPPTLQDEPTP